jgi:predicted nucleic acid-binding protein
MRAAVDTGALLALANPRDRYHEAALQIARRFIGQGGRFVGTTLVLAELHGHLLRYRPPAAAVAVLRAVTADRVYDWRDANTEMVDAALNAWMDRFPDQRFSLTDAVTFELMRRERLTEAFAFDDHFRVAGFRLLT